MHIFDNEVASVVLEARLASFIEKTFYTVDLGTKFTANWHIDLPDYPLDISKAF